MRLSHVRFSCFVATLYALRQFDLLLAAEQGFPCHLAQVEADSIIGWNITKGDVL